MTGPTWDLTDAPITLAEAKRHLNKTLGVVTEEGEIEPIIWAAVERVERHLGTPGELRGPTAADTITASQRLAILEVVGDYMGSQGPGAFGAPVTYGQAAEPVDDVNRPPLEVRLTDLLGPAAVESGDSVPNPVGCFPDPCPWPWSTASII